MDKKELIGILIGIIQIILTLLIGSFLIFLPYALLTYFFNEKVGLLALFLIILIPPIYKFLRNNINWERFKN
jgi:4-amino-4-deoxy-L-arabinose transferase-like glycosyltransferase